MNSIDTETRLQRGAAYVAELLATAFVSVMTVVSTLRLSGVLS